MSKNGEIYTAGKNFTLPPAVTALTNFTSAFPELIAFWHKVTPRAKSLTYFCKGTKTRQKENNLQDRTKHQGTHRSSSADWVCQSGPYNLPHNCQSGWPSHMETLTYSLTSCSILPLVLGSSTITHTHRRNH